MVVVVAVSPAVRDYIASVTTDLGSSVGRASASGAGGHGFKSWPRDIKIVNNRTSWSSL